MTPFQNRLWTTAGLAVLAATLTGCGKNDEAQSAGAAAAPAKIAADVKAAATKTSAAAQGDSNKTADGNTLRLQGTMQVDAGQGAVPMRSMATVIDAKLGEKTAAKLGTAQGQQALDSANASAQAKVSGSDIQDLANSMAGRTMYTSQATHIDVIKAYGVSLDAKSDTKGGPRMQVNLTLSETDMALSAATVEFYPDGGKLFESYKKKISPADVTIEKIERKDDKTLVLSGSFKATDLPAAVLAKSLKGQTLASVSGRFDFQEVPIRSK
ncbi:MAG: hypothetical protein KKB95_09770 [Gammaproteobacteria bacterium]|jgi:hypothetical protein|nr:hypothetical protein [Gammaproteobacteria bacterium]MBU1505848.1 hypothetical protein [Gammaproteobacteria bacterium]MBU2119536.1 hypothetical protein [Gammaproteobacteria bacterium]MBU2172558.1 hypothetical protein [Gammaproteobacteria bacterium]MBU2202016.1 hypothetical protein [Gammaproteobacteria bacterium]